MIEFKGKVKVAVEHSITKQDGGRTERSTPVFALTPLSDEYIRELRCSGGDYEACDLITIKNTLPNQTTPSDWIGFTVEEIYEIYKIEMQAPPDAKRHDDVRFSSFCFIVVDEACLTAQPQQCIIGCDAPDWGEYHDDTIRLKQVRVDIHELSDMLWEMEMLTLTPKEAQLKKANPNDKDFRALKQHPRAMWRLTKERDENGRWVCEEATPRLARLGRRYAIDRAVDMGGVIGRGKLIACYTEPGGKDELTGWEDY